MNRVAIAVCAASMLLSASAGAAQPTTPVEVPMVRILAAPDTRNGQLVRVTGYLVLEFEHLSLCMDKESEEQWIPFELPVA